MEDDSIIELSQKLIGSDLTEDSLTVDVSDLRELLDAIYRQGKSDGILTGH